MDRRDFTRKTLKIAGAASAGTLFANSIASAQTPDASPTSSPAASPAAESGTWESAEYPVTIEFDAEIFGDATTSGVTSEMCVLRIEDIDRFLSFIITLDSDLPTDLTELKDIVENDPELDYPNPDGELERIQVTEDNDAVGVLYHPVVEATPDQWSYTEYLTSEDSEIPTIHLWVASRTSKLDRELMETAVGSVMINGESAIRAIDVATLFDEIETLDYSAE